MNFDIAGFANRTIQTIRTWLVEYILVKEGLYQITILLGISYLITKIIKLSLTKEIEKDSFTSLAKALIFPIVLLSFFGSQKLGNRL